MLFTHQEFETALTEVTSQVSQDILLPKSSQPPKIPLHLFEILPSTNKTLWSLLARGATIPTAVIAAQQTAGRGQWGRQWQSQTGGLYLSLALAPNLQATHSPQLTFCSAWGIATVLRSYGIPVLLKWPNDLILLGKKLGGILTETRVQQGCITQAVVGVGINWCNNVPETGINLQSFCQEQSSSTVTSLARLAAIVLYGLVIGYQFSIEAGIEKLILSYQELLYHRGCQVIVDGKPGIVTGVTPTGELRVSLISGAEISEINLEPGTISLGYSS